MMRAWFEYKGINSRDMHLYIDNDIVFPSPEADIEFIDIQGRDGSLAVDNKRLKDVSFPIPVRIHLPGDKTVEQISTDLSEWLKNDISWGTLKFSGSPEYEYQAIFYEQFDVKQTLINYGKTVLVFRMKPYKKRGDSSVVSVSQGKDLSNPERRTAKPLINIKGIGNITLKNNGKDWLILSNVDGELIVDSQIQSVYKGVTPHFDKMNSNLYPLFPVLTSGKNVITWTGNVTELTITPRWEAVV